MLACENFGWNHERCLLAAFDERQHGQKADNCFAGANITLKETEHFFGRFEIAFDVGECCRLGIGECVREQRQAFFDEFACSMARLAAVAFHLLADQQEC